MAGSAADQSSFGVYVQPRSSRTAVVGTHGDAIKIKLQAPPVDGAANDELIRFVAKALGVPRTSVRIVSGLTSRRKRLTIDGLSTADAQSNLLKAADT